MRITLGSEPGVPDRENEDFAAAVFGAAVLLDGAGVTEGTPIGCTHGVAWFSGTLGALLLRSIAATPRRSLVNCLADCLREVRAMHEGTCDLSHAASPSSTVLAVRRYRGFFEYLVLGDSSIVLADGEGDCTAVTDRRLDEVGAPFRRLMDTLPTGGQEHTRALAAYRQELSRYRNRPGGFWIAGTDPEAAQHALTGAVPVEEIASVTLLSDGASRLVDRFQLIDWAELVTLLDTEGPHSLIGRVREVEGQDPEGRRWPRGKTQDDATILHWSVR
ncbi:protein phosphatase 2C domain-containing protein [Streptomyces sp. NPDC059256]|uniref:protein phosphatase 2C domain-containing protein n=1 Tax=Streptomyces sp. NPDC059256 TaxID=3346794 RepID=UPI0036C9331D